MNKQVKTAALYHCETPYLRALFDTAEYPWELLPRLKDYILQLLQEGIDGYTCIADGVLAGKNVKLYPTATVEGPAILGEGTEVRPGAFIRGSVITGRNCVLGNSSEFKNCILLDRVQAPHYNYVGDSVLGNGAHLGAGSVCSNLKTDGSLVTVRGDRDYATGLRKLGGLLGDGADVGCGCVLNPGTVLGKHTSVYPKNALRGVFPANCIVKSQDQVVERKTK